MFCGKGREILKVYYINTDLNLEATYALDDLIRGLEKQQFFTLQTWQRENGRWAATLEFEIDYKQRSMRRQPT